MSASLVTKSMSTLLWVASCCTSEYRTRNCTRNSRLSLCTYALTLAMDALLQVRNLLHKRIQNMYLHPQFQTDVIKPLRIDELMDQEVQHLSGGELQRVAITMCLGKEADLYLIDEPSAYLDSEQRIVAAKVITMIVVIV